MRFFRSHESRRSLYFLSRPPRSNRQPAGEPRRASFTAKSVRSKYRTIDYGVLESLRLIKDTRMQTKEDSREREKSRGCNFIIQRVPALSSGGVFFTANRFASDRKIDGVDSQVCQIADSFTGLAVSSSRVKCNQDFENQQPTRICSFFSSLLPAFSRPKPESARLMNS